MGYMRHHGMLITTATRKQMQAAAKKADDIGLPRSAIIESAMNGYQSMAIFPDGSKEGWAESDAGDEKRDAFIEWLNHQRYSDGSTPFKWVEVQYGDDNGETVVARHSDEITPPSPAAGEPADRDPIVLAAEAMRGMCAHALRRAMAATETLPGTLPLTAEECITIVENFAIPAVPVADAQVSASAQPSAPYAQEQAGEPAEMRPRCATCVSWVKRSDESNGLCREMSTLPSIQLRTRPEFGCVLHKETP